MAAVEPKWQLPYPDNYISKLILPNETDFDVANEMLTLRLQNDCKVFCLFPY